MPAIKLLIFDLDGTLVDAYRAIANSFNYALNEMGYPEEDFMTIKRSVGWGQRHLVACFVKKEDVDKTLAFYRKHHAKALAKDIKFLPYARRLLNKLKGRGYKLAVASNRPRRFTNLILKTLNVRPLFSCVMCADKVNRPKPYPDMLKGILEKLSVVPGKAIYVGDMAIDIKAGRRARIKTITVLTGSSKRGEILKENPYKIINNLRELPECLD